MGILEAIVGIVVAINAVVTLVQTAKGQEQKKKINRLEIELSNLKGEFPERLARRTILPPSRLP